jgi:diguanylate cyclase (GGDEF)-like protein
VRETDLVARYGGEEFTIVLSNTGRKEALQIAERIRRAVENLALSELPDLAPPVVTVSMGLACVPEEGTDAPEILMSADDFLYQAKQAGRNRVVHSGSATGKS